MGKPTTLATAVTTALNATTFSPAIAFTRTLLPILANQGQSIEGRVFLLSKSYVKLNRCSDYEELVDVGVYIVNTITNSTTDGRPSDSGIATMMDLCESVIDYMKTYGKVDGYQLVEIEQADMFDFSRIYEESIFETTIVLRYKGF